MNWILFTIQTFSFPLPYSFSLLPTGTAATSFGDETTYWSCSENRRRRSSRRRRWQHWPRLQPNHQPATKLDVVKLSNYIRKLQENLRRWKKNRQRRTFACCVPKQNGICWRIYDLLKMSVLRPGCWRAEFLTTGGENGQFKYVWDHLLSFWTRGHSW